MRDALREAISAAKVVYASLPSCHDVTDMWTEEHSHQRYGSLVVRLTDLDAGVAWDFPIGVWLCSGGQNYEKIHSWVVNRLSFSGVRPFDLLLAATDSDSNTCNAMIGLSGAWVLCAAHLIRNTVNHALGSTGETAAQRSSRLARSGGRPARARTSGRNDAAGEFLARCRAAIRFFEHSPVEALALSEIVMPDDVAVRNLVPDVPARWGSTCLALYRL